jgi:hypothetical protein
MEDVAMELTYFAPLARSSVGSYRLLNLQESGRLPEPAGDDPRYPATVPGVFHLANYIQVSDAQLKDGMLVFDLVRELPEV